MGAYMLSSKPRPKAAGATAAHRYRLRFDMCPGPTSKLHIVKVARRPSTQDHEASPWEQMRIMPGAESLSSTCARVTMSCAPADRRACLHHALDRSAARMMDRRDHAIAPRRARYGSGEILASTEDSYLQPTPPHRDASSSRRLGKA